MRFSTTLAALAMAACSVIQHLRRKPINRCVSKLKPCT